LGNSCMEIVGSDSIWFYIPMFFWPFGFRRERGEVLPSISIMGRIFFVPWWS
jgi:hypothetical protein